MKTIISSKSIVLVALAAIFVVSCSKESENLSFVNNPPVALSGSILDLGPLVNGTRVMQASLSRQDFTLVNENGDVLNTSAKVDVTCFVSEDGFIPSGQYLYSSSDGSLPYTFNSAFFAGIHKDDGSVSIEGEIVSGSIDVTHTGDNNYHFYFQGQLNSGISFTGDFDCSLDYRDNY